MFGLRNLKIFNEKLSSDSSSADKFINEFSGVTKSYSEYQKLSCDEA